MRKVLLSLLVAMGLPTAAWCADGDTFKMKIAEGVEMTFKVISEEEKTCQVGEGWYSCIEDYTGPVTVPSTANGYTVTCLGEMALAGGDWSDVHVTGVTLPETITALGDYAFENSDICELVIPNSVTEFGMYMFAGCEKLQTVTLPQGMTKIPNYLYSQCPIKSYTIQSHIKEIGECAFVNSGLESIVVPMTVEKVGSGAFAGCENLTHAEILNPNIELEDEIFASTSLTSFTFPEGIKTVPWRMFKECKNLSSVKLSSNVESIEEDAFEKCESLESIDLPNGLKTIGVEAFAGSGLKSITLPNSLENIDWYAFSWCNQLTEIQSLIVEPFEIDKSVFDSGDSGLDIYETATLIVPEGSEELYKNTPAWSMFYNLVTTGISRPEMQTAAGQHFTLDGRKAAQGQRGLQIVKQADGRVVKTFVR